MLVVAERENLPVLEAKAGDPKAWDILFRRYQMPLYVYVVELVHEQQAALDIVQETFIAATRHIASLHDDEKFGGWLFRIAHQKCVQLWRKADTARAAFEKLAEEPSDFETAPDDLLIRREQEDQFMNLLRDLHPEHRSVLLLRFIEDFSLDEIAQITNLPVGTVKSRLHYAKRALRALVEKDPQ
jgi:RNA polymerase sigma-70 factor (ECF subfamily)